MKIAILGAGAMGGLFGARLSLAGEEVWLLDVSQEIVLAIHSKGLTLTDNAGDHIVHPRAACQPSEIGPADLILVFVKSWATQAAARVSKRLLKPDTLVLTLQNGYGNAEVLAQELGKNRILAGTTAQGATFLRPGHVLHGGNGETHIGTLTGEVSTNATNIASLLTRAGIPTQPAGNIEALIWGKLVVNAGINAVTALTRISNGQLAEYPETRELAAAIVQEAAMVATATGITLPYPDAFDKVLTVAKATANNRSSMLQDILANRQTEINSINGIIVKEGERLGIPTPVNQILTSLITALEKGQENSRKS